MIIDDFISFSAVQRYDILYILLLVSYIILCHTFPFYYGFLDNFPPKIIAESNVINATLYEAVELNITAVDNDTIIFRVINKPPGSIVNQSGNVLYFKWNVTSSQKVGYRLSSPVNFEYK